MEKSLNSCYQKFLGSGNENSDLWIVGFEPGGNPFGEHSGEYKKLHLALNLDESEFIKYLNADYEEKIEGNTYQYVAKILEYFKRNDCVDRKAGNLIFTKNSSAFYTNLFPLSYPKEKHPDNEKIFNRYKNYFRDLLYLSRKKNYNKSIIEKRYKEVMQESLAKSKKIIVLKLGYEDYYAQLFNVVLDAKSRVDTFKVKWAGGYSEWPIYRTIRHKIGFLPNGRIKEPDLDMFLEKFNAT